ncbi:MAG: sensor domain-containing diguanylate cyclase [bacterium]
MIVTPSVLLAALSIINLNNLSYFQKTVLFILFIFIIAGLFIALFLLIRKRRNLNETIDLMDQEYNSIINEINYGVYMSPGDPDEHFTYVNKAMADLLGYENPEELLSCNMRKIFINPLELSNFLDEAQTVGYVKNKHLRLKLKDGSSVWVSHTARVIYDKKFQVKTIYGVVQDITNRRIVKQSFLRSYEKLEHVVEERTRELIEANEKLRKEIEEREIMERKLRYYATTDTMTGVFNRMTGLVFLENQVNIAKRNNTHIVVCFVDIDDLKFINDTYGHKEGDRLIIRVGEILKSVIRESDTICRMGGDEFLIIFPDCQIEQAVKIWERVEIQIKQYNKHTESKYPISFSHGFAEYNPDKNISVQDLIANSDKEMYKMKNIDKHTAIGNL